MRTHQRTPIRYLAILGALALGLCLTPSPTTAFTGALSSADFSVLGTGNWIGGGDTVIEWTVTQNTDNSWRYAYLFSHPCSWTRNFLLETSAAFTRGDMFNECGSFGTADVAHHTAGGSNQDMPDDLYGIIFKSCWGRNSYFQFDSFKSPVWGDVYARGWSPDDKAWNQGFTAWDDDPSAPPMDGTVEHHLLVPDSGPPTIPEPSALLLLGTGLLAAYVVRRRLS